MGNSKMQDYIKNVLVHMPTDWIKLTTHRLDVYDEQLAKTKFLEKLEVLFNTNNYEASSLSKLPTAYDYIRLGHPLSCLLEWAIAKLLQIELDHVISFSSRTAPILAVLRKNLLDNKNTRILYINPLPDSFDIEVLQTVYGYQFELQKIDTTDTIYEFEGSTLFITQQNDLNILEINPKIDFLVNLHPQLGSVLLVNGKHNAACIQKFNIFADGRPLP